VKSRTSGENAERQDGGGTAGKRERERGETNEKEKNVREREREDARGAKIRMSVGMPLSASGGVYRMIQRARKREKESCVRGT